MLSLLPTGYAAFKFFQRKDELDYLRIRQEEQQQREQEEQQLTEQQEEEDQQQEESPTEEVWWQKLFDSLIISPIFLA